MASFTAFSDLLYDVKSSVFTLLYLFCYGGKTVVELLRKCSLPLVQSAEGGAQSKKEQSCSFGENNCENLREGLCLSNHSIWQEQKSVWQGSAGELTGGSKF